MLVASLFSLAATYPQRTKSHRIKKSIYAYIPVLVIIWYFYLLVQWFLSDILLYCASILLDDDGGESMVYISLHSFALPNFSSDITPIKQGSIKLMSPTCCNTFNLIYQLLMWAPHAVWYLQFIQGCHHGSLVWYVQFSLDVLLVLS